MSIYSRRKWSNPKIELFHGTLQKDAASILGHGIDPLLGRANTDFGRGFYTTTWFDQARRWAEDVQRRRGGRAAVVKLTLDRLALRSLRSLAFVRGTADAEDFWSFILHCRNHSTEEPLTHEYYDVVYGPVALRWGPDEYEILPGMDQISFHGMAAKSVLGDKRFCTLEVIE